MCTNFQVSLMSTPSSSSPQAAWSFSTHFFQIFSQPSGLQPGYSMLDTVLAPLSFHMSGFVDISFKYKYNKRVQSTISWELLIIFVKVCPSVTMLLSYYLAFVLAGQRVPQPSVLIASSADWRIWTVTPASQGWQSCASPRVRMAPKASSCSALCLCLRLM